MATTIEVKLLFSLEMQVESAYQIGDIGGGTRAIGDVSGRFEGAEIAGTITGTDWYLARPDGIGEADIRATLKTNDGALIYMRYSGLVDMRRAAIPAGGAAPTSGTCAVRTAVRFEPGAERYRWLNQVQGIGIGEVAFETGKIKYSIYAI